MQSSPIDKNNAVLCLMGPTADRETDEWLESLKAVERAGR